MSFTNAQLAQQIANLIAYWAAFNEEYANWLGGAVDGGPGSDGNYPLTDYTGVESLVACPAKLADNVDGYVGLAAASETAAAASALAASNSETAAAASAVTASAQAALADADRIAAELAESGAVDAKVTAIAKAAAAVVSAAAALASEQAAAASEAAAAISETNAAASAAAAATFDPALFAALADNEDITGTWDFKTTFIADGTATDPGTPGRTVMRFRTHENGSANYMRTYGSNVHFALFDSGEPTDTAKGIYLDYDNVGSSKINIDGSTVNASTIANWDTAFGWGDHASPIADEKWNIDSYTYLDWYDTGDSNRMTLANKTHVSMICDSNTNGTGEFTWSKAGLTHALATNIMTLTNGGNLAVVGTVTGSNLNVSNWDTAYGWGDHSVENYAVTTGDTFTGAVVMDSTLTMTLDGNPSIKFDPSAGNGPVGLLWNAAGVAAENVQIVYRSSPNTLNVERVSDGEDMLVFDPATLQIQTGNGGLYVPSGGIQVGAETMLSADFTNFKTAYGWGDHSTENYAVTTGDTFTGGVTFNSGLTSFSTTFGDTHVYRNHASNAAAIKYSNLSGTFGYAGFQTGNYFAVFNAGAVPCGFTVDADTGNVTWTGGSSVNANTAYGWGDHSTQNYAYTTGDTFTGNLLGTRGSTELAHFFVPGAPEDRTLHSPMLQNYAGYCLLKGGSITWSGLNTPPSDSSSNAMFTGRGDKVQIDGTNITAGGSFSFEVTLPATATYTAYCGIVFGAASFRCKDVKVEAFSQGAWLTIVDVTDSANVAHFGPITGNSATGTTKLRYTLGNLNGTYTRLLHVWIAHYNTNNLATLYLPLDGGTLLGGLTGTTAAFSGAVTGSNLNVSNWDTAYGWGNHASAGYAAADTAESFDSLVLHPDTTSDAWGLRLESSNSPLNDSGFWCTSNDWRLFLRDSAGTIGVDLQPGTTSTFLNPVTASEFTDSSTGGTSSQWNTAYGWGNHSVAGYISNIVEDTTPQLGGNLDMNDKYITSTNHGRVGMSLWGTISTTQADWSNLPNGAHHMVRNSVTTAAGAPVNNYGYFTKVAQRDSSGGWAGLWVGYSANQTYVGRATTSADYATWEQVYTSATFTDNSANWDTAFGWGDHSTQNYALTTGDTFTGTVQFNSTLRMQNDIAITWRDFAGTGRTLLEMTATDVFVVGNSSFQTNIAGSTIKVDGANVSSTLIGQWNTAYGWGDHASGGYAPTASPTFTGNISMAGTFNNLASGAAKFVGESTTGSASIELHGAVASYIDMSLDGTGATDFGVRLRYYSDYLAVEGVTSIRIGGTEWSTTDIANHDTAYGWGDHSTQNYAVTTGDTMTGDYTFKGKMTSICANIAAGATVEHQIIRSWNGTFDRWYEAPKTDGTTDFGNEMGFDFNNGWWYIESGCRIDGVMYNATTYANWNTAYGWGDHSVENYAVTTGDTFTGAMTFSGNINANGNIVGDGATTISAVETVTIDSTGDITKSSHGNYLYHQSTSYNADQAGGITFSTSAPTGGVNGDIWFEYT